MLFTFSEPLRPDLCNAQWISPGSGYNWAFHLDQSLPPLGMQILVGFLYTLFRSFLQHLPCHCIIKLRKHGIEEISEFQEAGRLIGKWPDCSGAGCTAESRPWFSVTTSLSGIVRTVALLTDSKTDFWFTFASSMSAAGGSGLLQRYFCM